MRRAASAKHNGFIWLAIGAGALLVLMVLGVAVAKYISNIMSLSNDMITARVVKSGQDFDLDRCMAIREGDKATIMFGGFDSSSVAVKSYMMHVQALDVHGRTLKTYTVNSDGGIATGISNVTNRDMESVTLQIPKQSNLLRCSLVKATLADGTSWTRQ